MSKILECVPNISEGRDAAVIDAVVGVLDMVDVLNVESDRDHNRTVITFVGDPEDVVEGAFRLVEKAAELIDMGSHKGVHPRLGAADVLPLVPLVGLKMEEVVEMARDLGRRITAELGVPVYMYEKAALIEERANLAEVRKNGGEPDFGGEIGSAGVSVVGARDILVAYNVNLKSLDLGIAKEIARRVRKIPSLKALGLMLKECAQVSMNLVNYRETNMSDAFAAVEEAAKKLGVEVLESELIGLAPQKAFGERDLLLKNFSEEKVLDLRISHTL